MLPKADPSRQWQVINCGGISYASYRIAILMEELARYEPDLFVIYNGENEFLEHRTYHALINTPRAVRGMGAVLSRTRVYTALSAAADKIRRPNKPFAMPATLPAEVETMLDRVVGPEAYHRDDELRAQVLNHYRFNLRRMSQIARSAGARIIFVTPASNLRDCSPFKSENRKGMTPADYRSWQELAKRAAAANAAGRSEETLTLLDAALRLDDRFAALHYLRGRMLWELKRFDEAKTAFVRARDEDVCPLRALTPVRGIIAEVTAQRHETAVDFVKIIDELADHGTPGSDWFLDHVHPTIDGNRRLAMALLEAMSRAGVVRPVSNWGEGAMEQVRREVEARLTAKDHGTALCTAAKVLAWAGKYEEALNLSVQGIELAPDDPSVHFEAGKNAQHLGRTDEAVRHLQRAIEMKPRFVEAHAMLGSALASNGKLDDAIKEYQQGLEIKPDYAEMHCNLGALLERRGDTNEAILHYVEAIRILPRYAEAHSNLGWSLKQRGELDEALRHFREATRWKPGLSSAMAGMARILATHPDARVRNPIEAIKLAERLADLSHYENWVDLDTLAAAYASAGRYQNAVRTAQKAVELARAADPEEATLIARRLALYQKGEALTEGGARQLR